MIFLSSLLLLLLRQPKGTLHPARFSFLGTATNDNGPHWPLERFAVFVARGRPPIRDRPDGPV